MRQTAHNARSQPPFVTQRFEAKYLLTDVQADLVLEYIAPYVMPDAHQRVYPVTSLYLDSPDLATFTSSLHGEKNRFKLRIRGYDSDPGSPAYCEVKQRIGRVVRKYRAAIRRDAIQALLHGHAAPEEILYTPEDDAARDDLVHFARLAAQLAAAPTVGVHYRREACESIADETLRITIDRDIAFMHAPKHAENLWLAAGDWHLVDHVPTVLEIKFTNAFPYWVSRMIRRFELTRVSLAKYVVCVKAMRREGGFIAQPNRSPSLWTA